MENTFNINDFDKTRQAEPASFPQCRGLGYKFAGKVNGKPNYKLQKQIQACLYAASKLDEGFLTFKQADVLFTKKTLPKVYKDQIKMYLEENS